MVFPRYQSQVYLFVSTFLALCLLVMFPAQNSHAHEVRPAIVDLHLDDKGAYELGITLNLEAVLAGIGSEHEDTDEAETAGQYNALRALQSSELEQQFRAFAPGFLEAITLQFDDTRQTPELKAVEIPEVGDLRLARDSKVTLGGTVPKEATGIIWQWPAAYGSNVLRVSSEQQADVYTAYLQGGQSSEVIPLGEIEARSAWGVFTDYVQIGFAHILPKGLDHILFVVGLFLLSASFGALLWQVTSFTLAHSVTLALGMLGWVQISPAIVEPLIAASIVYVCLENVFSDKLSRWRPAIIFGFGLLHGLGFASVLTDVGLSGEHFALGLIAFNVGVEIGQLFVILLCFLAVGFWFRHKAWYRSRITIPASLVIAAIGLYWFLERTVLG